MSTAIQNHKLWCPQMQHKFWVWNTGQVVPPLVGMTAEILKQWFCTNASSTGLQLHCAVNHIPVTKRLTLKREGKCTEAWWPPSVLSSVRSPPVSLQVSDPSVRSLEEWMALKRNWQCWQWRWCNSNDQETKRKMCFCEGESPWE